MASEIVSSVNHLQLNMYNLDARRRVKTKITVFSFQKMEEKKPAGSTKKIPDTVEIIQAI